MSYRSYDAVLAMLRAAVETSSPCAAFGVLPTNSHKPVIYIYWSGVDLIVNTFGDIRDAHPAICHPDVASVTVRLAPLGPTFLRWIEVIPAKHERPRRVA